MPTNDFDINLSDELNFWAARVFERVRKKFVDMNINTSADTEGYTGDLYRTMHWEVHNAAAGNPALIKFFYLKYGDYVQWGVGRKYGDPRWPKGQKSWKIPRIDGKDAKGATHPKYNYTAKPFLRREVVYHSKWLIKRLAEQYAYWGNFYMVKGLSDGMEDPSITEKWIKEHQDALSKGILNLSL